MKNIGLFLALTVLCACAGNPPRWWNPSGQYDDNAGAAASTASSAPASLPAALAKEEEDPMNLEQSFDPSAESFEELSLSPYPQDEAQANESAPEETPASSSDKTPASAPQDPEPQPEAQELPAAAEPVQAEEHLPEDGSLPPPSVLEDI